MGYGPMAMMKKQSQNKVQRKTPKIEHNNGEEKTQEIWGI